MEAGAVKSFPAAMVNITNRCTLRCRHCFVFRQGNPNDPKDEMDDETMLTKLAQIQQERGIEHMLWMGGEPLLRPEILRRGSGLFKTNTVTTNGTIDLIDLPNSIYVVSLDGPPEYNDAIRGKGSFAKVMRTLERIPEGFGPTGDGSMRGHGSQRGPHGRAGGTCQTNQGPGHDLFVLRAHGRRHITAHLGQRPAPGPGRAQGHGTEKEAPRFHLEQLAGPGTDPVRQMQGRNRQLPGVGLCLPPVPGGP